MNLMPDFMRLLGLEEGDKFSITVNGESVALSPYQFIGNQLVNCNHRKVSDSTIVGLLDGHYSVKKLPWRPEDGEEFYFVNMQQEVVDGVFDSCSMFDVLLVNAGNCFKTGADALNAASEIVWKIRGAYNESYV